MTTSKWTTPNSLETILSTELNSLANGARAVSAAFSNNDASELYLFADFELFIAAQGAARAAGAYVSLYLLPAVDGSNFTFGDAGVAPPVAAHLADLDLDAATAARTIHLVGISLRPVDYKLLLVNSTGQALAAASNTVKMQRYNVQGV